MKQSNTILDEIFIYTKKTLEDKKKIVPVKTLEKRIQFTGKRNFKNSLQLEKLSIIAEIKKKSPSKGILRKEFDHNAIADQYEKAHVNAISVITEPNYFGGQLSFISDVKKRTTIPILRKDFIFDPYQIYETRIAGADAFLLIASILTVSELRTLLLLGKTLQMDVLVEAHNLEEINNALEAGAEIIGINNRDLHNFNEDIGTFERLAMHIPKGKIRVAESAIKTKKDIERMQQAGAHAVLVGTTFMRSSNISKSMEELKGNV